jgi:uncharacterized membrane protein
MTTVLEVVETKKRTTFKTISWRIVAIANSWIILAIDIGHTNLEKALLMNATGFFVFYFFERLWSKVNYGRIVKQEQN